MVLLHLKLVYYKHIILELHICLCFIDATIKVFILAIDTYQCPDSYT